MGKAAGGWARSGGVGRRWWGQQNAQAGRSRLGGGRGVPAGLVDTVWDGRVWVVGGR